MRETYTVHMDGETFWLSQAQIEFDSPNYFTSCFLGEFAESKTRVVTVRRDPGLFKIVLDYLNGYEVLPLYDSVIPERMDQDMALRNLLADAQFYLLDGLVEKIRSHVEQNSRLRGDPATPIYMMLAFHQTAESLPEPILVSEDAARRIKAGASLPTVPDLRIENLHTEIRRKLLSMRIKRAYVVEAIWDSFGYHSIHFLLRIV